MTNGYKLKHGKKCHNCKIIKPIEEFWKHLDNKDGYKSSCISCEGDMRRNRKQSIK
jgi:hypothetical protein